jgi:hypothetical protein
MQHNLPHSQQLNQNSTRPTRALIASWLWEIDQIGDLDEIQLCHRQPLYRHDALQQQDLVPQVEERDPPRKDHQLERKTHVDQLARVVTMASKLLHNFLDILIFQPRPQWKHWKMLERLAGSKRLRLGTSALLN